MLVGVSGTADTPIQMFCNVGINLPAEGSCSTAVALNRGAAEIQKLHLKSNVNISFTAYVEQLRAHWQIVNRIAGTAAGCEKKHFYTDRSSSGQTQGM